MPDSAWLVSSSAWTHASRAMASSRALTARDRHLLGRSQPEACLDGVGEEVVGLIGLAGQQPRDPEQHQRVRPAPAVGLEELERELRVRAHPRHSSLAAVRAQEDQPRVDRARCRRAGRRRGCASSAAWARRSASAGRPHSVASSAPSTAASGLRSRPSRASSHSNQRSAVVDAAALVRGRDALLDEPRHAIDVAGLLCVPDRPLRIPVHGAPLGCPRQQAGDEIGLRPRERGSEQFLEEVVIPVPLAAGIERHQEQIGVRQRLEHGCGSTAPPGPRRTAGPTAGRARRSG